MKNIAVALAVVLTTISGHAAARNAGTDPLEFSYRISGGQKVRPVLVFNDGADTFIQPNPETEGDLAVKGSAFERQGPYLVIKGIVQEFQLVSKKHGAAQVVYSPAAKPLPLPQPVAPVMAQGVKPEAGVPLQSDLVKRDATNAALKVDQLNTAKKEDPAKEQSKAPASEKNLVANALPSKKADAPVVGEKRVDPVTEERAKTFIEELKAETKSLCKPVMDTKESAFVVAFAAKSSTLSTGTLTRLKGAIGNIDTVSAINGFSEDSGGNEKLAAARAKTISDAIREFGVPASKIVVGTRRFTGIGTELRIEHATPRECEMPADTIVVTGPDKNSVSVGANADAKAVMEKLATHLGMTFRVEGMQKPIQLKVVIRDQSMLKVLSAIGDGLGKNADVVLRNNEIALRYKD